MNVEIDDNFDEQYKIYIASGFGAFFLGIGDLITNDRAATVLKIGRVIKDHVYAGFIEGGLVPLIFLVILGAIICWVHQPKSRIDAFARGFSVFAVLAVVTPYQGQADPRGIKSVGFLELFPIINIANADTKSKKKKEPKNTGKNKGVALFRITEVDKNIGAWKYVYVILKEPGNEKIIAERRIMGTSFSIIKPPGAYVIEIESPGYRSVKFDVDLTKRRKRYVISVNESIVPIGIQRLLPAKEISIAKQQPH